MIEINQSQQHQIDISNVNGMLATRENTSDRSAAQFLDLLTSQAAVSSKEYVSLGLGKLFQLNGELMDRNAVIQLRCGLNKGIQPVEKDGKPSLALVVDGIVALFNSGQSKFSFQQRRLHFTLRVRFLKSSTNVVF